MPRLNFLLTLMLTILSVLSSAAPERIITGGDFLITCQNTSDNKIDNYCLGVVNGLKAAFSFNWNEGYVELLTDLPSNFSSNKEVADCQQALRRMLDTTINPVSTKELKVLLINYIELNPFERENPIAGTFSDLMLKLFKKEFSMYPVQCTPNMTYEQREHLKTLVGLK